MTRNYDILFDVIIDEMIIPIILTILTSAYLVKGLSFTIKSMYRWQQGTTPTILV